MIRQNTDRDDGFTWRMAEIRFVEINGLYSYGNKKNRIDFGQKTAIVGTNDSGKSSIFKALNHFLKCLTEFDSTEMKPWDTQDAHEMTVGLVLNDAERRYVAEILAVTNTSDGRQVCLAPDHVVEWLAAKLEHVELAISWKDRMFHHDYDDIRYALRLEDLGLTVCSIGYNRDVWTCHSSGSSPRHKPDAKLFSQIMVDRLKRIPTRKKLGVRRDQQYQVSQFPVYARLASAGMSSRDRSRIKSIMDMSRPRKQDQPYSFFLVLGDMLEQRFAFVSEQRRFQESNDLEMLPLKDDGSNLQGFLYWLQNGDKDKQDACSAIQKMFEDALKSQKMSFIVSMTERDEILENRGLDEPLKKVYPNRAVVRFAKTRGQRQQFTDFMSVGAGIRETLFLLARCFGQQDKVILLDEPAANLHPTQIRQLMNQIMSSDAKSGQVAVVTHSPTLASLEVLSSVDEIARVDRQEHSHIVQPVGEDREWIKKNLPTFHLLKSDILFAKKVVLVEGNSDKIFLESILNHGSGHGNDVEVVSVGGSSFDRFRRFLDIFEIPFVIMADNDAENRFDSMEVLKMSLESFPQAEGWANKKVCLLKKDLEGLLSDLEPKMYGEVEDKYRTKPELAYHFVRQFFAEENSGDSRNVALIKCLKEWIMKDVI